MDFIRTAKMSPGRVKILGERRCEPLVVGFRLGLPGTHRHTYTPTDRPINKVAVVYFRGIYLYPLTFVRGRQGRNRTRVPVRPSASGKVTRCGSKAASGRLRKSTNWCFVPPAVGGERPLLDFKSRSLILRRLTGNAAKLDHRSLP